MSKHKCITRKIKLIFIMIILLIPNSPSEAELPGPANPAQSELKSVISIHLAEITSGSLSEAYFNAGNTMSSWAIECVDCPKQFEGMTDRSLRIDSTGRIHTVYGQDHLYYAWLDGDAWQYVTVDESPSVGMYAALYMEELTPAEIYAHISYFDGTNGALKYAYQDGDGWHIDVVDQCKEGNTSLAVDGDGYPHFSYISESDHLMYAVKDDNSWHVDAVDSGNILGYASLALDASGHPRISYIGKDDPSAYGDLMFAYQDGAGWHTEIVHEGWGSRHTSLALDENDYPRISYSDIGMNLRYAYQDSTGWHNEVADDYPTTKAEWNSLALDAQGYPHISYFNDFTRQLKYAFQDGTGWHIEDAYSSGEYNSLAFDPDGIAHISSLSRKTSQLTQLVHKHRDEASWQTETVDTAGEAGRYTSITLDDQGYPHISYREGQLYALKYAYRDQVGWHNEVASDMGRSGYYTSLKLDSRGWPHISHGNLISSYPTKNNTLQYSYKPPAGWINWNIVWGGLYPDYGRWTSLAIDSNDHPHITCDDNGYDILRYAYKDSSTWQVENIDIKPGLVTGDSWYGSLALDQNDTPYVSYRDIEDNTLILANRTGPNAWHKDTVDNSGDPIHTSLALSPSGYAHITYRDQESQSLKYAFQDATGWHKEIVDNSGNVGGYASIALDGNGFPRISYYDYDNGDLKYAYRDTQGWYTQTVDSIGDVGWYSSLTIDKNGNAHISYYDASLADLKYAFSNGTPIPPLDKACFLPLIANK